MSKHEKIAIIQNLMERMPLGEWIARFDQKSFERLIEERNRRAFNYRALAWVSLTPFAVAEVGLEVTNKMGFLPVTKPDTLLVTGITLATSTESDIGPVFEDGKQKKTSAQAQRLEFGFASTAMPYRIAFAGVKAAKGAVRNMADINVAINIVQAAFVEGVAATTAAGVKVSSVFAITAINCISSLALGAFGLATYAVQNLVVNPLKAIYHLGAKNAVKFYKARAMATLQEIKAAFRELNLNNLPRQW